MKKTLLLGFGIIILMFLVGYNGYSLSLVLRYGIQVTKALPLIVLYVVLFLPVIGMTFAGLFILPYRLKRMDQEFAGGRFFLKSAGLLLLSLPVFLLGQKLMLALGFYHYSYMESLSGVVVQSDIFFWIGYGVTGLILLAIFLKVNKGWKIRH